MNMKNSNPRPKIYFTGVGGQGTLTATKLLAQAALDAGIEAVAGEVHGMAQRGGVVESALLLGGWRAPRLDRGEADILLGFEALETLRGLEYLKDGGIIFSSTYELPPLSVSLGQEEYPSMEFIEQEAQKVANAAFFIPCHEMGKEAGAPQSGNTALLGALCASGFLPFGEEPLKEAICKYLPEKIQKINLTAMQLGVKWMKARQN